MAGRVITFYSYKGGVGRSLLLANTAAALARWGHRVLCVDWDLEAPGLDHYFRPWMTVEKPGIVDLVAEFSEKGTKPNWINNVSRIHIDSFDAKFDFISAGIFGSDYLQRAQSIDWENIYAKDGFGEFLEEIRSAWKSHYDFILIDSRTGISDLAGISTVHLPDQLVFVFTANYQSLNGVTNTAARIVESRNQLPFDRERLLCLPVLSRFAVDKEYELANEWMGRVEEAVSPFYLEWLSRDIPSRTILLQTRIPESAYWTFGERLPVVEDKAASSDPQSIVQPIFNIAALLAHNLSGVQQLVLNRDAYLASAVRDRMRGFNNSISDPRPSSTVFISAPFSDLALATELSESFRLRGLAVRGDWGTTVEYGDNWKQELLRELRIAKYLVVLIGSQLDERQSAAVESFFALSVREHEGGRIIPVVLTMSGIKTIPSILRPLTFIDGTTRSIAIIAEKCLQIIFRDTESEHLALV